MSYTDTMHLVALIGSVLILLYFLTLAGTILANKALLPVALTPLLYLLQSVFSFLYDVLTNIFSVLLSLF